MRISIPMLRLTWGLLFWVVSVPLVAQQPTSSDDRLTVELVVEHPDLVTPTGLAIDADGRVFVAESHTHFRPDDYDGPTSDRILVFEDTNGDGRANHRAIFHEGFTHVMDLAFHPDGSLYVATRMDIHRLRDTNEDGKADEVTPIVRMETTGTYPHNGLSGLAFQFDGSFHFGLGENLGRAYTLIGTDGTRLSGGGEGGSTYHVRADGTGLRRVSTGWWNPFGMAVDAFGRVFGTDNDPNAAPPCRLIQVVNGGDYGYEYRYGRSGLHPLVSWTGQLPGTLSMIAGTGEAPCGVVAYESDALPDRYRGQFMVSSWADHQIECYSLSYDDRSGFVQAQREILVRGPNEFRPVGIAVSPDGTIYFSDWVSASYTLHGQGRIWRIRPHDFTAPTRPTDPYRALFSSDLATRERAARSLARTERGCSFLVDQLDHDDPRVRMIALQSLTKQDLPRSVLAGRMKSETDPRLRLAVLDRMITDGHDVAAWAGDDQPIWMRAEAVTALSLEQNPEWIHAALTEKDSLLFRAGVLSLARGLDRDPESATGFRDRHPLAWLLAAKLHPPTRNTLGADGLREFLASKDSRVRLTAVKWVADDLLSDYRPDLETMLKSNDLDLRLFLATSAALDRLDGNEPRDQPAVPRLIDRIQDEDTPVVIRQYALRLVDPNAKQLPLDDLTQLRDHPDLGLRRDALRTLAATGRATAVLADVADDPKQPAAVRAVAIDGVNGSMDGHRKMMVRLANSEDRVIRDAALRSLVGVELDEADRAKLRELSTTRPDTDEAVKRLLLGAPGERPDDQDIDQWLTLLKGVGDPIEGERIFFGTKVGMCAGCHRVDGRGNAVGPELTTIRQRMDGLADGRRWLMETIVQPSKEMAPEYTPWIITMTDGRVFTGLPLRKGGGGEAYLGADGKEFSLKKSEIESHEESRTSIMPRGLLHALTRRELEDLFAYLEQGVP